jgi:hypothetical protein
MSGTCYPVGLDVADDPASWASAGFTVVDDSVALGEITIRLLGRPGEAGGGLCGWRFVGLPEGVTAIHGIPTSAAPVPASAAGTASALHPNGAVSVDHIVFQSPDAEESIKPSWRRLGFRRYGRPAP